MNPIVLNHFGRRTTLIEMLRTRGARVGVEVGTDRGQYAEQLCRGIPELRLYCIDPYVAYTEGREVHSQKEVDKILFGAVDRLEHYDAEIRKTTSIDAVNGFDDNSLDFVFIDGNHSYEHVLEDVTEWTKKVKPGGVVCGHDYKEDKTNNYGVIEAVNEYTEKNHIAPLFILRAGGTYVDCWLFFKQP